MISIAGRPFWTHPSDGWTDTYKGLTEAQLDLWQDEIGFKLPERFRELMAEQNGGRLRCLLHTRADDDEGEEICIDSLHRDKDGAPRFQDPTLKDIFGIWHDDEGLREMQDGLAPCYPERAVIISSMNGHDFLVLDYGWREISVRQIPRVVILEQTEHTLPYDGAWYEEEWSAETFDTFLEALRPPKEGEEWLFGLVCDDSFAKMSNAFANWIEREKPIGAEHIEPQEDKTVFPTAIPLDITPEIEAEYCKRYSVAPQEFADWLTEAGRRHWFFSKLVANQYSVNAWHFPEHQNVAAFLKVPPSWFNAEKALPKLIDEILNLEGLACKQIIRLAY